MRWGSVAVLAVVRPARLQVRPVTREVSHPVSLVTRRAPGTFQGKKALDGLYVTPALSPLSLPHQEGHTWCSRTFVTVKEGMEARTEYGLELNSFPVRLVQITHLSYQGVFRLRCRQGTDRQTGESPLNTWKRPESVCGEFAGRTTDLSVGVGFSHTDATSVAIWTSRL